MRFRELAFVCLVGLMLGLGFDGCLRRLRAEPAQCPSVQPRPQPQQQDEEEDYGGHYIDPRL